MRQSLPRCLLVSARVHRSPSGFRVAFQDIGKVVGEALCMTHTASRWQSRTSVPGTSTAALDRATHMSATRFRLVPSLISQFHRPLYPLNSLSPAWGLHSFGPRIAINAPMSSHILIPWNDISISEEARLAGNSNGRCVTVIHIPHKGMEWFTPGVRHHIMLLFLSPMQQT